MAINEQTRQRLQNFASSERFKLLKPETQQRLSSFLGPGEGSVPQVPIQETSMQTQPTQTPGVIPPQAMNIGKGIVNAIQPVRPELELVGKAIVQQGMPGMIPQAASELQQKHPYAFAAPLSPVGAVAAYGTKKALETDFGKKAVKGGADIVKNIEIPEWLKSALPQEYRSVIDLSENINKVVPNSGIEEAIKTVSELTVGGLSDMGAEKVAKKLSEFAYNQSGRTINAITKGGSKVFSYGKDPGRGVAREGIIANSYDDLENKISSKIDDLQAESLSKYRTPQNVNKRLNLNDDIFNPIDDKLTELSNNPRQNSGTIKRLEDIRDDFLGIKDLDGRPVRTKKYSNLSPEESVKIKRGIGNQTKYTGNQSDDEIVNKVLQKIYRNIDSRVDRVIPGTKELNARMADLITAKALSRNRAALAKTSDIIPLIETALSTFSAIGSVAMNPMAIGGLAPIVARRFMRSPFGATRTASALTKTGKNLSKLPTATKALRG